MVCDDVRRIAYFFLDGQLGENRHTDLQGHVQACPSCDGRLTIHRRLREFIRRRLAPVTAPPPLRDRIRNAIHKD